MRKLLLGILLISTSALADDFNWRTSDGSIAPNMDSRKAIANFGGWLVITPDPNWESQWHQHRTTPKFTQAKQVKRGETITILPFFANPKLDNNANFLVSCDITVTRPDGTFSINETNIPCAQGKLTVSPQQMFLSRAVIKYIGENKDPLGEWKVTVTLTDKLRGVSLPLTNSFELVK